VLYVTLIFYLSYRKHEVKNKFLKSTEILKSYKIDKGIKEKLQALLEKHFNLSESKLKNLDIIAQMLFNTLSVYIIFNGLSSLVDIIVMMTVSDVDIETKDLDIDWEYIKLYIQNKKEDKLISLLNNIKLTNPTKHTLICYKVYNSITTNKVTNKFPKVEQYILSEYPNIKNIKQDKILDKYVYIREYIKNKNGAKVNEIINKTSEKDILNAIKNIEINEYYNISRNYILNYAEKDDYFNELYRLYSNICRVDFKMCKKMYNTEYLKNHPDKSVIVTNLETELRTLNLIRDDKITEEQKKKLIELKEKLEEMRQKSVSLNIFYDFLKTLYNDN
jgi:hypothetical protein